MNITYDYWLMLLLFFRCSPCLTCQKSSCLFSSLDDQQRSASLQIIPQTSGEFTGL